MKAYEFQGIAYIAYTLANILLRHRRLYYVLFSLFYVRSTVVWVMFNYLI